MAANDLTASEIEARPATEPAFLLSARIYDSATNRPDQFTGIVTQLERDSKAAGGSGPATSVAGAIKIDYDPEGKVAAITINNENLYNSSDAALPGKLANNRIDAEVVSGDLGAVTNDSMIMTRTFGLTDKTVIKQAALDHMGSGLGSMLQQGDVAEAGKYLAQLQQTSGPDNTDLMTVLQKAKDASTLGSRVTIETDSQSGALTAFKLDGKDLLQPAASGADVPTGPISAPVADKAAGPVPIPDSSAAPAVMPADKTPTPAGADGPSLAPPPDPAPVVTDAPPVVVADAPKVVTDAPAAPTPASPGVPPVDLFNPSRSEIPTAPAAAADSRPPAAAVDSKPPASGADSKPPATGADSKPPAEVDQHNRQQYEKALSRVIDHQTESLPVRRGEGYYQVVSRMHKDWSGERIMKETHRIKDLNGRADELKVGQRLPLVSHEEKAARLKKGMDAFDHATPEQRQQMLKREHNQATRYSVYSSKGH